MVLHNGSPVEMPWADQVKGIVEAYLSGQAVGAVSYTQLDVYKRQNELRSIT